MLRKEFQHRPAWQERCAEVGFDFYNIPSHDGSPYWREGVGYELTSTQVDYLDDSTTELHAMCMDLVREIVGSGNYPVEYGLSEEVKTVIERSWRRGDKHLYGRFDLAFDGHTAKMLEYNADTPTGLLEASVAQWNWVEEVEGIPNRDQFNSIHEKLIGRWGVVGASVAVMPRIHFAAMHDAGREDWGNLEYLMDTAVQAGIDASLLSIEDVGWDGVHFVDLNNRPIVGMFKLYPWEWMVADGFGRKVMDAATIWIEPSWKMLLSNKVLLPLLWNKHKGHALLVPAQFDTGQKPCSGKWVHKPMLAREGANITMIDGGVSHALTGSDFNPAYDQKYVFQEWVDLPRFDRNYPVVGSWVIGDESAGIGIREDCNQVTGNDSHFVPHYTVE
jgi:glutathionylspermidine synthase